MVNNIGTRIRRLRENLGISQTAMAHELDITQSNYGRLEKDDERLNVPKLKKIAEILQVSVIFLFDEDKVQENKEHIASLKEEITFLRTLLKNKD
jgi:transcriptional regulator with XRE-family HTH domain